MNDLVKHLVQNASLVSCQQPTIGNQVYFESELHTCKGITCLCLFVFNSPLEMTESAEKKKAPCCSQGEKQSTSSNQQHQQGQYGRC